MAWGYGQWLPFVVVLISILEENVLTLFVKLDNIHHFVCFVPTFHRKCIIVLTSLVATLKIYVHYSRRRGVPSGITLHVNGKWKLWTCILLCKTNNYTTEYRFWSQAIYLYLISCLITVFNCLPVLKFSGSPWVFRPLNSLPIVQNLRNGLVPELWQNLWCWCVLKPQHNTLLDFTNPTNRIIRDAIIYESHKFAILRKANKPIC